MARVKDEIFTIVSWFGFTSTVIVAITGSIVFEDGEHGMGIALLLLSAMIGLVTSIALYGIRSDNKVYPRLIV